jgi:lipoyl(octanoyl) transferase
VAWLGQIDYREAWELQRRLAALRAAGSIPDTLLLLEHPPTITVGRSARNNHIVAGADELRAMGVSVIETDRGGDVTYHGPGQLVGYPILNLQSAPHSPDLHRYLRSLEETLIRALAANNVEAGRFPGYTGVWTGMGSPAPAKIAAIGIKTSRWITMHGFAFNICTNMRHFELIVPCGIQGYGVTSLAAVLHRPISVLEAVPAVVDAFADTFRLCCVVNSSGVTRTDR